MNRSTQPENNLSVAATNIVSNALLASYHLFCPFCSDFYLFEFSFKEHLKREHADLLQKHFKHATCDQELKCDQMQSNCFAKEFKFVCDLCGAMFMYAGLIPKHIINYHGTSCFATWQRQQQQLAAANQMPDKVDANSDVTIMYAKCSPGLSDIFDRMSTNDTDDFSIDRSPLKSILKKSESKSVRIISSPSSSCIRRIRNSAVVKRSTSARRILRFDIENTPPQHSTAIGSTRDPVAADTISILPYKKCTKRRKKSVGKVIRRIFFGSCVPKVNQNPSPKHRMVTSTPINLFCDTVN